MVRAIFFRVVKPVIPDNFAHNKQKYFRKTIQITSSNFELQFASTCLRKFTGCFKSTVTNLRVVLTFIVPCIIVIFEE